MVAPAATLPHSNAILATLTAAGITAYLANAGEETSGLPKATPYVVIHVAGGIVRSTADSDRGSLGDPNRDVDIDFQTTAVSDGPEGALNLHDLTVAALLGSSPTVSGRTTVKPVVLDGPPLPIQVDRTAAQPLFYGIARWTWRTSV